MPKYRELLTEGQKFLDDSHFLELNEPAKLSAISYMRGLKDGARLAEGSEDRKQESELAAV